MAGRFEDRHPDFADLCSIRMSELHPRYVVITVDESSFRTYRRNKRESIPLLTPRIMKGRPFEGIVGVVVIATILNTQRSTL